MGKLCYVIMPYGGTDQNKINHYNGIYSAIIEPAARAAGYTEILREDHVNTPGAISHNIVKHLAEADMVIADLSHGNANVFYELGIRHVFSKGKTVLICDSTSKQFFDTAHLQIVYYDASALYKITETQEKIKESILQRLQADSVSDNSVHDAYPSLPISILNYINTDDDSERETIRKLQVENAELLRKLKDMGFSKDEIAAKEDEPIEVAIERARKAIPYSGRKALLAFRELAEKGDHNGFLDFLKNTLTLGTLDESDFIEISQISKSLNNNTIRQIVLEVAVKRYPDNENLQIRLVDVYNEVYETKAKAVEMSNRLMGVTYDANGNPIISKEKISMLTENILAAFFDSYIAQKDYQRAIKVAHYLLENKCRHNIMLYRNIAFLEMRLGRFEEAKKYYLLCLKHNYKNDVNHKNYSRFLYNQQLYTEMFEEEEIMLAADPNDSNYCYEIAGDILDRGLLRTPEGLIISRNRDACKAAAIPFLIHAFQNAPDQDSFERLKNFMLRNRMKDEFELVIALLQDDEKGEQLSLDFYPLNYCLNLDLEEKEQEFLKSIEQDEQ